MLKRLPLTIATLGYLGYLPYAPGTVGSLAALLLIILFRPSDPVLLLIFLPVFIIGTISADNVERVLGKDSPHIIIDEFCGFLLSVFLLPRRWPYLISAFILFRFFDILKPPPIKKIERGLMGGTAIVLDDIIAAIYANLCIQLWRVLF